MAESFDFKIEIKQTCTSFYTLIHEWDLENKSENIQFIGETNSIKNIEVGCRSSFIKDTFDSGVHHWKFKIDVCTERAYWKSTIGIWKAKPIHPCTDAFTYGFVYNRGRITNDGTGHMKDDYGVVYLWNVSCFDYYTIRNAILLYYGFRFRQRRNGESKKQRNEKNDKESTELSIHNRESFCYIHIPSLFAIESNRIVVGFVCTCRY